MSNYTGDIEVTTAGKRELRWHDEVNGVSHAALTETTYRTMQRIMRDRGLRFSTAHWSAIFALCRTLTEVAQGKRDGRIVWGMPTGCGKTTVVEAFLIALAALRLDHVGVVVCQNRIGSLVEMRRELRKWKVADDRVTLLHSDKQCSEPSDDLDPSVARQFVLMTHAAVIDRGRLRGFREWNGRQRVVVWDEALWTQEPTSIDVAALAAQLSALRLAVCGRPDLQEALDYLTPNSETAISTVLALKEAGEQTGRVPFATCLDFEKLERMRTALVNVPRSTDVAEALLSIAQLDDARVRTAEMSGGVISYRESIPGDLGSIVVLDASWAVRDLLHQDRTLTSAEDLDEVLAVREQFGLASLADLKTYHDVTVTQVLAPGGWYSVIGTKNSTKKGDLQKPEPVLLEVIVQAVLDAEGSGMAGVLVYLFKERDGDPSAVDMLKAALEARRPGITTKLTTRAGETKPTTWLKTEHNGSETGFNYARHCGLVILWGVLHDADHVITSKMVAASDDLDADLSHTRVLHFRNTEKHHRILQAISRGAMRNPGDKHSSAAPMSALVIDPDETLGIAMEGALPGIHWHYKPGPKGYSRQRGLPFLAKRVLKKFLKSQPRDVEEVMAQAAKAAVVSELDEQLPDRTWRRLRDAALVDSGWKVSGRRLVRRNRQTHRRTPENAG
jgi:hypothetical protein